MKSIESLVSIIINGYYNYLGKKKAAIAYTNAGGSFYNQVNELFLYYNTFLKK